MDKRSFKVWRCEKCGGMQPGPDLDLESADCHCGQGRGHWGVFDVTAALDAAKERLTSMHRRAQIAEAALETKRELAGVMTENQSLRKQCRGYQRLYRSMEPTGSLLGQWREKIIACRAELADARDRLVALTKCNVAELADIQRTHAEDEEGFVDHGLTGSQGGVAHRHREKLLALVSRLTTPRPIAEAPKDGTWVLGFWDSTTDVELDDRCAWLICRLKDGGWFDDDGDSLMSPTHFLPLPVCS